MRQTIEITFKQLPPVDYVVSFKYYPSPGASTVTATVTQVAKALRGGAGQFTIGATVTETATNLAAAMTADFPSFSNGTFGGLITITTAGPANSPIFDHTLSSTIADYVVKTGSSYQYRFAFLENPTEGFTTNYTLEVPKLPLYDNLLLRFTSTPSQIYDSLLGVDIDASVLNLRESLYGYLPVDASALFPYSSLTTGVGFVQVQIDYLQKVQATFAFSGNPANGTDISFQIKKNHVIIATITRNMSNLTNNATNVLIGATAEETMENFVNNLKTFNPLPDTDYIAVAPNQMQIRFTGVVSDLWDITVTLNTTATISLFAIGDFTEPDVAIPIYIPNTVIFDSAIYTKVRSSELLITTEPIFNKTQFKFFVWTGSVFEVPDIPYVIVNKAKIIADQDNIFINVNPFFKKDLDGDIYQFLNAPTASAFLTNETETKWAKVIITNMLNDGDSTAIPPIPDTIVGTHEQYYYILDGYIDTLDIFTDQNDDILLTGRQRYVERDSKQAIFFKTTGLQSVDYHTSIDPTEIPIDITQGTIGRNSHFVKGIGVITDIPDIEWIRYHFVYEFEDYFITYNLYDACNSDGFQLVFKNRHGMLEAFPVTQRRDKRLEVSGGEYLRSIVDINGFYDINRHTRKSYNVGGTDSVIFNTDWLPEYMNAPIKELALTEELWIVDNQGNSLPVNRVSDTLNFKTQKHDKLIQYNIAVKLAHDTIKNIQ